MRNGDSALYLWELEVWGRISRKLIEIEARGSKGPPIGTAYGESKWLRDRWRHITLIGQSCDLWPQYDWGPSGQRLQLIQTLLQYGGPIGNVYLWIKWSRDRRRHVTLWKFKVVTLICLERKNGWTTTGKRYGEYNDHVTDNVTWPWNVRVMTTICLRPIISTTVGDTRLQCSCQRKSSLEYQTVIGYVPAMTLCDPKTLHPDRPIYLLSIQNKRLKLKLCMKAEITYHKWWLLCRLCDHVSLY